MNISNINVNKYPISQLFDPESNVLYEIPKYQREYIWGSRQWEDLFDDLYENNNGYFLGSIICINSSTDVINSPKFEVVDGQQRLTTISLFLAALNCIFNDYKDELDDDQQADILQLKRKLVLKKTDDKMRIIPQIQNHNMEDYRGLLSENGIIKAKYPLPKFAGNRRISKALNYFKKRITELLEREEDAISVLFTLLDRINSAIIVKIDVSNHSDAYTLFESLNNRGTPLTAIDLIKTLLLSKLDNSGQGNLDYYFEKWTQVLDLIGDDYSTQERFFRHNYNAFRRSINSPFAKDGRQYPLGIIATKSNLLDIYEKMIGRDPKAFIEDILDSASIYSSIILKTDEDLHAELKESYLDINRIQGAPSYLLLLYLVKEMKKLNITQNDIIQTNKLLVKFFVRRNLTDTPPTRDLTRIFMNLIEEIEDDNCSGQNVFKTIRDKLIANSASDSLFEEKLHGPIYSDNAGVTRFILCTIAKEGMTLENHVDLWKINDSKQFVWTIEHIFPQGENIPEQWVQMIASGDKNKAKEYQEQYVHSLGNLTITGYNQNLGNRSFEEKRDRTDKNKNYIGYRNGLNLNSNIASKNEWTVDEIKIRTESMVSKIMSLFEF